MGNVLVSFYIFFAEATFQLQYHLMTKKPSKARWVLFKDRAKLAIFLAHFSFIPGSSKGGTTAVVISSVLLAFPSAHSISVLLAQ